MTPTLNPQARAWEILFRAEETDAVMSLADERAGCGAFASPASPGAYLFWLEDEAEIQEAQAASFPDEAEKRLAYAAFLRETAGMLRDLGFTPVDPRHAAQPEHA